MCHKISNLKYVTEKPVFMLKIEVAILKCLEPRKTFANVLGPTVALHRCRKQFHFGGGANIIYTAITAICTACMNINKVSRVKYWGALAPPAPPSSYAYDDIVQQKSGLIN